MNSRQPTHERRNAAPLASGERAPGEGQSDGQVLTRKQAKVQRPRRWKVLLHNDDYSTMDFVVDILVRYFRKSPPEAMQIMLQVHQKGLGVAGIYPRDEAETKVAVVTAEARELGMPLVLTAEPEDKA